MPDLKCQIVSKGILRDRIPHPSRLVVDQSRRNKLTLDS